MTWYKLAKEEFPKMEAWFRKRTKNHIALVQKYCKKIEDYDSEKFKGLVEQAKDHDVSKFEEPEIEPYIYITWQYKCKEDGHEFEAPKDIDDRMNRATQHHVTNKKNRHHPESHTDQKIDLINRRDRDKPPKEIVDATKMNDVDIGEMVADWMSVSGERGSHPKDWADKNIDIRWKFTSKHKSLIYELIEEIF